MARSPYLYNGDDDDDDDDNMLVSFDLVPLDSWRERNLHKNVYSQQRHQEAGRGKMKK